MNVIGLLLFLAILFFLIRFTITILAHLFRVFGWIGSDITTVVAKTLDIKMTEAAARRQSMGQAADLEEDELAAIIPRRKALQVEIEAAPEYEPVKEQMEEEQTGEEDSDDAIPRRSASRVETEAPPETVIPEQQEEELSLLMLLLYAAVFAFSWTTNFFLSIVLLPRRISRAVKMPFPARCTLLYFEIFLCILPIVVIFKVPDIYGYKPTLHAVYWGLFSYPCYILLVYLLRVMIPVDLETVFQSDGHRGDIPRHVRYRHVVYGTSILALSILLLYKLALFGLILMCFMYSALYFFAFSRSGNPEYTFRRFLKAWLAFAVLVFIGVVAVRYGVSSDTLAGYALFILILISLVFVHTLWVMSRKYQLAGGVREIPLIEVGSWMNQFLSPLVKLAVALPMFYFIILFFSIKTSAFYISAALAATLIIVRRLLAGKLPRYAPGGLFAGYVVLVWVSIFFVQSFNRIPPSEAVCDSLGGRDKLKPLYTSSEFNKAGFLAGTLPYDAALAPEDNALFVTFKNLSGYGAVVRLDASSGKPVNHLITENDRFPGEMFYPERLCLDRQRKLLFSTTKSSGNFQLLAMDYSGGLKLSKRHYFYDEETTNCRVDNRDGTIYVIFLGPPSNNFKIIDPVKHELTGQVKFGRFGYADYFVLDKGRERLIAPSLDPANRFAVYDVRGLDSRDYSARKIKIPLELTLFGGLKVGTPVPTLGIAYSERNNRVFFSCPFLRLVFEADADSFKPARRVRTGRFPREIAVNETHNLLLVANYGEGNVQVFNLDTLELKETLNVGKLVRSITVDEETGRTFIVTGCGVFEYMP